MANQDSGVDVADRRPIKDLQPHVVIQFWDHVDLAYRAGVEKQLVENELAPWDELVEQFGDVRLVPLFTAIDPEKISALQKRAVEADPDYKPTNLLRFWRVDAPTETDLDALARTCDKWQHVQTAYVDRPGPDPMVMAIDDPRSANQGYLDAAPDGIDAEYAWGFAGGDGAGQRLIDLERGWTLNHEDISGQGATLLHGTNRDSSRGHGTSVLGEICAVDNTLGCIGIAPEIGSVDVVSFWMSTRPDAILAAIDNLGFGEVLLLEAQAWVPNSTDDMLGPIEVLDADYEVIRLATALGIIVVEAGGNGTDNGSTPPFALDTYTNAAGDAILWRDPSNPDFRDSGAIIVSAATSTAPRTRLAYGPHGSRIDCHAWAQNIDTLESSDAAATDLYRTNFGGTSGASPIVAGAALLVQGIAEQSLGFRLSPAQMRSILSDPTTNTNPAASETTEIGVMPDLRAIIDTVINVSADVYIRDNTSDNGDPHTGSISASPDIITRPSAVANPQATYGEGSGTENTSTLGSSVAAGQDNFIYTRMRNRGGSDAADVRATVFWSEVSTLVTPDLWNLVGDVVVPNVPSGDILTVSDAITWASADIPADGHYCYVGLIGNPADPAPTPTDFMVWDNFRRFILENNNATWRNFNVVASDPDVEGDPVVVDFLAPGAPDRARRMSLEVCARLPQGARLAIQMPARLAEQLGAAGQEQPPRFRLDSAIDLRSTELLRPPAGLRRPARPIDLTPVDLRARLGDNVFKPVEPTDKDTVVIPVNPHGCHRFNTALFPAKARNRMKLLVEIPKQFRNASYEVYVRQIFDKDEVGRVTWRFSPKELVEAG